MLIIACALLISILPVVLLIAFNPTVAQNMGPNGALGFRFASTRRNEKVWVTAHYKAWPWVIGFNLIGVLCVGFTWFSIIFAGASNLTLIAIASAFGAMVLGVVLGALAAVRTANNMATR